MFILTEEERNNPSTDTLAILPPMVREEIFRNAIKNNNIPVVKMALELGGDPNILFEYRDIIPDGSLYFEYSPTALDVAIIQKRPLLFKTIHESGGSFDMRSRVFGNRAIISHLCKDDDFSCLSVLISKLPHIDSPYSQHPETLLSSAAHIQNIKAIEFLLAHGADVYGRLHPKPEFMPRPYVYTSAITGIPSLDSLIETLEFLDSMGASLHGINEEYSYPYEIASYKMTFPHLLEYFLSKGIDLKKPGRDALLSAVKGSLENVKFLMDIGHSKNVMNERGETPLDVALLYGRKDVIEFLLSKDAPYNTEKALRMYADTPEILNLIKR
jgi:ankyrin repeat protein